MGPTYPLLLLLHGNPIVKAINHGIMQPLKQDIFIQLLQQECKIARSNQSPENFVLTINTRTDKGQYFPN